MTALPDLGTAVLAALAGAAFGLLYFRGLRLNARLWLAGRGLALPLVLHLARLAAAVALFVGAALAGAPALFGALAGFLAARAVLVRPEAPS
ncbi:N-ATPase subunit AtpR [Azospirillum sp. ST 5-10]|uniref:N-ATPase subunit AtpR n=1 Tax=unclassified Azospirillum TaxID=2630922 RepID=UPI003F4A54B0